jgi:hypothetical protein
MNPKLIELHATFFGLVNDKMAIERCEAMLSFTYEDKIKMLNDLSMKIDHIRREILNTNKFA